MSRLVFQYILLDEPKELPCVSSDLADCWPGRAGCLHLSDSRICVSSRAIILATCFSHYRCRSLPCPDHALSEPVRALKCRRISMQGFGRRQMLSVGSTLRRTVRRITVRRIVVHRPRPKSLHDSQIPSPLLWHIAHLVDDPSVFLSHLVPHVAADRAAAPPSLFVTALQMPECACASAMWFATGCNKYQRSCSHDEATDRSFSAIPRSEAQADC
jgi:hypothetical protein